MRTIGIKSYDTLKVDKWLAKTIAFYKDFRIDKQMVSPRFKVFGCVLVVCGGRDTKEVDWKARRVQKFCQELMKKSLQSTGARR